MFFTFRGKMKKRANKRRKVSLMTLGTFMIVAYLFLI